MSDLNKSPQEQQQEIEALLRERDEARKEAEKQYAMVLEGASLLAAMTAERDAIRYVEGEKK